MVKTTGATTRCNKESRISLWSAVRWQRRHWGFVAAILAALAVLAFSYLNTDVPCPYCSGTGAAEPPYDAALAANSNEACPWCEGTARLSRLEVWLD